MLLQRHQMTRCCLDAMFYLARISSTTVVDVLLLVDCVCDFVCNSSTSERNGCRFGVAVTRQNVAMTFGAEKLEWCGYSPLNFFLKICLFDSTESTNVADTQTAGRTDGHADNALRKSYRHIQLSSILHFYSLYYFAFKIAATEDKYPEC